MQGGILGELVKINIVFCNYLTIKLMEEIHDNEKNLLKTIAISLTMVTLTGSLLACSGGGDDENKATKEAATTKKVEATTEKPTEETTTEAPTEHVYKGFEYNFVNRTYQQLIEVEK